MRVTAIRSPIPLAVLASFLIAGCAEPIPTSRGMDAGGGSDSGIRLMDGALPRDAAEMRDSAAGDSATTGMDAGGRTDAGGGAVVPPLGGSSDGTGGGASSGGERMTGDGIRYRLIVPGTYRESIPNGFMIVFSGTEGAGTMAMNLLSAGSSAGLADLIFAVLDGPTYFGDGSAGASVLDHVRTGYDVDNDRTFLLSESAGTRAGLTLGLDLRQSYFAAYWANDVNAAATPAQTAAELGFAPWGNAGPGGDFPDANAIVAGMRAAGYRIAEPAPYDGMGAGTHGDPNQFFAALRWFVGRTR